MINLSQEEFEKYIEMLVNGEITKVKLAKKLETDVRTLDNRIQELVVFNPDLYEKYLEVLPYRQRTLTHIDFEALLIHMLKQEMTVEEAAEKFEISPRTIRRRINSIENKDLVELYREVAENRKRGRKDKPGIVQKILELEERQIVLSGINDQREQELLKIEAEYNRLCQTMGKREAARQMGLGDRDRVFKLLNELYKIKIEKNMKASKSSQEGKTFRESFKVDETQIQDVPEGIIDTTIPNLVKKDEELGGE